MTSNTITFIPQITKQDVSNLAKAQGLNVSQLLNKLLLSYSEAYKKQTKTKQQNALQDTFEIFDNMLKTTGNKPVKLQPQQIDELMAEEITKYAK